MKKLLTLFVLSLTIAGYANAQTYNWVRGYKSNPYFTYGTKIVSDNNGFIYTSNSTRIYSNLYYNTDKYVLRLSKTDLTGNTQWTKQYVCDSLYISNISTDNNGNVYFTGNFAGTIDFNSDSGESKLTSKGKYDIFICKLDAAGKFQWVKQLGGTNTDNIKSIALDTNGNIYLTGNFMGTTDFDPNEGTATLTSVNQSGYSTPSEDIFMCKLDASGNFVWVKQIGGNLNDKGYSIKTDNNGNIYLVGSFSGQVDFDPSSNWLYLTSTSNVNIFVSKYNSSGGLIWAKQIEGTQSGNGNIESDECLSVDASNNVYISGSYYGTMDINPSTSINNITSNGSYDIFFIKLNASGNFVWGKSVGGSSQESFKSIDVDNSGNSYISGRFSGKVDFDPSDGVYLDSASSHTFISKFNSSGNFLWMKKTNNVSYSMTVDENSAVYTTGSFTGDIDFDPSENEFILNGGTVVNGIDFTCKLSDTGSFQWAKSLMANTQNSATSSTIDSEGNFYTIGTFSGGLDLYHTDQRYFEDFTSLGNNDIYITKKNSDGLLIWAKHIGGAGIDKATSIKVDTDGNIYVLGYFEETVDFDPGEEDNKLTASGKEDIFILKLNSTGNYIWAKQMGGRYSDKGNSLTIDKNGDLILSGDFVRTSDFNPGTETNNLYSFGENDIFVCKLDNSGLFKWVKQLGGTGFDYCQSSTADNAGNIYLTGNFQGTADFDPGEEATKLTSAGENDVFVCKISTEGNLIWARQLGGLNNDVGTAIAVDNNQNVYTTGNFIGTGDFNPSMTRYSLNSYGETDIFVSKLNSAGDFVWAKQLGGSDNDSIFDIALDAEGSVYTIGCFKGTADFDPGTGDSSYASNGNYDIFICKLKNTGLYDWVMQIGGTGNDIGKSIVLDSNYKIYATGQFEKTVDFNPNLNYGDLTAYGNSNSFILKLSQDGLSKIDNAFASAQLLYPNPTKGKVNIRLDKTYQHVKLTIVNNLGQVMSKSEHQFVSEIVTHIYGGAGLYYIKIETDDNKIATLKLTKQ